MISFKNLIITDDLSESQVALVYGPHASGKTRSLLETIQTIGHRAGHVTYLSKKTSGNINLWSHTYHGYLNQSYGEDNIFPDLYDGTDSSCQAFSEHSTYILDDFHCETKAMRLTLDLLLHQARERPKTIIIVISSTPSDLLMRTLMPNTEKGHRAVLSHSSQALRGPLSIKTSFYYHSAEGDLLLCPSLNFFPASLPQMEIIHASPGDHETVETPQRYYRIADVVQANLEEGFPGSYLVFLPGRTEISLVCELINVRVGNMCSIVCLSENSQGTCDRMNSPQSERMSSYRHNIPRNTTTIYLSDGTAETGRYLRDIGVIVESLVIKDEFEDTNHIRQHETRWISRARLRHRMARFSVDDNHPRRFVLMGSESFMKQIPESEPDSYTNHSLEHDILKLVEKGFNPYEIFQESCSPLVDKALRNFVGYGLITGENLDLITSRFLGQVPLETRLGMMVWKVLQMCREEVDRNIGHYKLKIHLSVISMIKCYSTGIVRWPRRELDDNFYDYSMACDKVLQTMASKYGQRTSLEVLYAIWMDIHSTIDSSHYQDLRTYCHDNCFLYRRFDMAQSLLTRLLTICNPKMPRNSTDSCQYSIDLLTDLKPIDIPKVPLQVFSREIFRIIQQVYSDQSAYCTRSSISSLTLNIGGENIVNDERFIHDADLLCNPQPRVYAICVTQRTLRRVRSARATPADPVIEQVEDRDFWESPDDDLSASVLADQKEGKRPEQNERADLEEQTLIKCFSVFHLDPDQDLDDGFLRKDNVRFKKVPLFRPEED